MLLCITCATVLFFIQPGLAHAATADETKCASLFKVNLTGASILTPDDKKELINPEACNAYQYLISKLAGKPPEHATGLTPEFACRLARLIKGLESSGQITILSGYRSPKRQGEISRNGENPAACGPREGSYAHCPHVTGRAADLTFNGVCPGGCKAGMHSIVACQNDALCSLAHKEASRYGLIFPLTPRAKCGPTGTACLLEAWHIELDRSVQTVAGSTKCGDVNGQPGPGLDNVPTSPTTRLTEALRNIFGVGTPPQAGVLNRTPMEPGTCNVQIYCAPVSGVYSIVHRDDRCVDTPIQACQYGCNGNTCNPPPPPQPQQTPAQGQQNMQQPNATSLTLPPGFNAASLDQQKATTSTSTSKAVEELLRSLAEATTTTSTTTVVVRSPISTATAEILRAQGVMMRPVAEARPAQTAIATTSATYQLQAIQDTFPDQASVWAESGIYLNTQATSTWSRVLGDMAQQLRNLLTILQPFRGKVFKTDSGYYEEPE